MQNTARDENIGVNDSSSVDKDCTILDRNVETAATKGLDRAITERAAVRDGAVDHVILENACQLAYAKAASCTANSLESGVGWRKDGNVRSGVKSGEKVGGQGCSRKGR